MEHAAELPCKHAVVSNPRIGVHRTALQTCWTNAIVDRHHCVRQAVVEAVHQFVSELRAGGPYAKGWALAKEASGAQQSSATQPPAAQAPSAKTKSPAQSSPAARVASPAQTTKVGCCRLHDDSLVTFWSTMVLRRPLKCTTVSAHSGGDLCLVCAPQACEVSPQAHTLCRRFSICSVTRFVLVQAPPGAAEGSRSVSLTERFHCRPADLFESLTDERRIRAYTQVTSPLCNVLQYRTCCRLQTMQLTQQQ